MPLYEYQCDACGGRFERIQKFSDPPVATCPACGGAVKKLVSSPAFQFKGSGWYVTDYARKSGGAEKEKEKEKRADKDSSKSGDAPKADTPPKADAKPSEKTEKPAGKPATTGAKDA